MTPTFNCLWPPLWFLLVLGSVPLSAAPKTATATNSPALYRDLQPDTFMKRWLVLSPVAIGTNRPADETALKAAFAKDPLRSVGGESNVRPTANPMVMIEGQSNSWRSIDSKSDSIDLSVGVTNQDFFVGYAFAEIEMRRPTKLLFGFGSDDALKVWLNGKVVHENSTTRLARSDDDLVEMSLQKGRNQILIKVLKQQGRMRFVCRPVTLHGLVEKLVEAAGQGDLDAVKSLQARGVSLRSRGHRGLTAWQAARIHGRKSTAEYLQSQGVSTRLPTRRDRVVDAMFEEMGREGWAGAAVLVAENGRIVFEKGYGLANLENQVAVTPETVFRIGSITKQFIAAGILKLHEQGKLALDDKLTKFVPDFPRGDEVTIHHLLTHTSGIHSYTGKPDFYATVSVPIEPAALINSFKNDPYDFNPGQKWLYNNSGYFLLGYILEKVSGRPYGEYLRENFFEPLGMTNTGVHTSRLILRHEANGYSFEDGAMQKSLNWDMSRAGGAGSLYSTVRDLFRWNEAVFNGRVLYPASLQSAFTPVITEENKHQHSDEGYGYGWGIGKLRGLKQIHHSGGLQGFLTYLLRIPEKNFSVVVLMNAAPPPPGYESPVLGAEIAELFLGDQLDWRPEHQLDKTVPTAALEACVGRYQFGELILTVTREGSRVFAQFTGEGRYEIFPKSGTEFFWRVADVQVTFVKDESGKVMKAALQRPGSLLSNGVRLPEAESVRLTPTQLDAYVGRYDYGGGKAILTVTREGDRLFAQLTGQPRFEIFPKSETEFFWKAVAAKVTFVKDANGKVVKGVHEQAGRKFDAPKLE